MSALPRDDIAIIGLSCRFPGATTAEEYWKNLCDGIESITFFSDQELVATGINPCLVANPAYVKAAAMLRDVEMFDASFFGYSPKEAALMDPQHRLFLEVCWETFEGAGYDPSAYPGKVGVLATAGGVVTSYLLAKLHHPNLPGQTASASHISNDKDFLSTRISYKFDLTGSSFTIQSACSSSLLAVHQACQNLRLEECDMMLVGGSVIRIPQVEGYLAEKRNVHSLDGRCRPFDGTGQGTIFGSGVGAVLLKPLRKAVADRDHVFAVIKGTAANNDGSAKNSYAAPSLGQQSQAVADALKSAGISADSIGYVECHATGTLLGDPIEIEALTKAFREHTDRKQYCAIGSVKANIGHPEQAAGIAGLIKTALVLHHKRIPPSINFHTPNPAIEFASSPFSVNAKLQDFRDLGTPRRAAVNSLGIGGTNVFAVLEEAPPIDARDNRAPDHLPCLITLSAKSAPALVARCEQMLGWLNENPDAPIGDICYTTNVSRSQFGFRFAAPARSAAGLKKHLTEWLRTARKQPSQLRRTGPPPIAFLFSGQGSQHAGMGAGLYRTHSIFRKAMDRCHALAESYLEQGLLDVIFANESDLGLVNRTEYTQPALFAIEYALVELLKSWGIAPNAVIGHSLGEITAACAADAMTLKDAMRLVNARGALMRRMKSSGGMTAIFASENAVRSLLEGFAAELDVAAINGPENTVVSGDLRALKRLSGELDGKGIIYRELQVSNAFHSQRTEPILDEFENVAGQIKYAAPELPLISNLTGKLMPGAPDKYYWRRHVREPVRFGDGMLALAELGCSTFLEIGPHRALLPMAQACLGASARHAVWISTLNRQKSDADAVSDMLTALYLAGHKLDWAAVHTDGPWRRMPLPTYPFERQRHWLEDAEHPQRTREPMEPPHPLVGARVNSAAKEVCYEVRYGVRHASFLSDHRIAGNIVLPTTAELEVATVVGRTQFRSSQVSFEGAMHHQAMSFANGEDRAVKILVTPQKPDRAIFKLVSADAPDSELWQTHMTGTLRRSETPRPSVFSTNEVRARCQQEVQTNELYERLASLGLEYGPRFRGVREFYLGQHEALAKVALMDGLANEKYLIHPALLDACLHAYPLVLNTANRTKTDCNSSYLPVSLEGFRCYRDRIDKVWAHLRLRSVEKDDTQVLDIHVYDDAEQPVADLQGLAVRQLAKNKLQPSHRGTDDLFYRMTWRKGTRGAVDAQTDPASKSWIIFADKKGIGAALAAKLETEGHRCHLVYRAGTSVQAGGHVRTWTVNEGRPQDFRRLLEEFASSETLPCHGVIYLWGLDAPSIEGLALAQLKSGCEMICGGALALLQAVAESRSTNSSACKLWFVSTNAQKAAGRDQRVDPVQAPLWGLGRTAAIEYPGLWGGLIDLQFADDRIPNIDSLATELLHPDGETQVAISADNQRNVARFVRLSLAELEVQAPQVRGDATYLVTGGLGMLGRSVVEWLLGKGAKYIVVTGRSASADSARDLNALAEKSGSTIEVITADICREEDVSRVMLRIRNEFPPLKGVVHSAGILDDGILALLDWDRFSRVFEPKVYGSWLLHEATKSLDLDFFVLQSSLLSQLGSAGQANYSAANSFLDCLATHRRSAGLPATAINWSAWSGGGLATASGARGEAMWSALGIKYVPPDLAIRAFDTLMRHDVDHIAVAMADWPTYAGKIGSPPLLTELVGEIGPPKATPTTDRASGLLAPLNGKTRPQFLQRLQTRITAELGFAEPVDLDQPLNEVGLDSLRSVTLANELEDEFGVLISISQLISGPTIRQIANHLSDLLAANAIDKSPESESKVARRAAIGPLAKGPPETAPANSFAQAHHTINGRAAEQMEIGSGAYDQSLHHAVDSGTSKMIAPDHTGGKAIQTAGKWLIAPRPDPKAGIRLFCFPYAGGGLVSFREWAQRFDDTAEVVAVEAPGRGTRINEAAVDNLEEFVAGLLPEMVEWLDRPSAFFGHCLGGLTMFATLRALPKESAHFVKHAFACGVRPPQLLKRGGEFEDNLIYDMMLHRDFDAKIPPFAQSDEIFADIIRQFDTPAADKMLEIPKLRKILLPTIRAEFRMAYNYSHRPVEPFAFPISSFVGDSDPWVSEDDSAAWAALTRGGFANHVCKGSHFLMADDGDYIVEAIKNALAKSAIA
jgi:acyl transferase domain-containing protein/surfactin synthase thioesterase subunit/acyl carrier protein